MARFRKKPVVIEAVQASEIVNAWMSSNLDLSIPTWAKEALTIGTMCVWTRDELQISTLEGVMTARPEDWIIRGVKNEIYPCRADIFEATYEPVGDA